MPERRVYTPDEFQAHLEAMAQRQLDVEAYVRSAHPLIIKVLQSQSKKAFHSQVSPSGQAWAPLAHTRPRGSSGHVLRDTGELMASLTGGPFSIEKLSGTVIEYGTESWKAFHDKGGMIQRKNSKFLTIPASKEAFYVGGMRNFPRRLSIIWDEGRGKGIAFERIKKKRKPVRQRGKAKKKQSWLGKKIAKAKKAARAFLKRVRNLFKKRRKKRASRATARVKKPKSTIIIHYYLRSFVIIPQRKFLEVSKETQDKIAKILMDQMFKHMNGKL